MNRALLIAIIAVANFFVIAIDADQRCQRLANELGIHDAATISSLQNACQQSSNASRVDRARHACAMLLAVFGPRDHREDEFATYFAPQSPGYINRTESYWSDNCWQNASCIVSPKRTEEVAQIMRIIKFAQSTFSIRSGGHDFNVNHSSVGDTGILIDMANLNQTTLSTDKTSMSIGVGARWGSVYQALNGSGVSINGGRSPNPGVGGQTLGGGIGWFSSIAGVSAASVVAVEVVLANGSTVRADHRIHPELLWAMKGGGPNYGIATSFTYKTLPIDRMWFESRVYAPENNQRLLDALVAYQELASKDSKASIVYQLSENITVPQSFVGFLYFDPIERPSVFSPFYDIPQSSSRISSTIGNLAELAAYFNDPVYPESPPSRDYVVSMPHSIDNSTYQESYAAFSSTAAQAATFGAVVNYGSQPFGLDAVQASLDTPLGLTNVNQDWIHVTAQWASPLVDVRVISLVQDLGHKILASATKHNADLPYRFMNDAYDGQKVLSGYGADNLMRLKKVAKAYDPEGVFQKLQNGGWLLSRT